MVVLIILSFTVEEKFIVKVINVNDKISAIIAFLSLISKGKDRIKNQSLKLTLLQVLMSASQLNIHKGFPNLQLFLKTRT